MRVGVKKVRVRVRVTSFHDNGEEKEHGKDCVRIRIYVEA